MTTNGQTFGIGETPNNSSGGAGANVIDVTPLASPLTPWRYMATVMRGMRYRAEMVALATSQVEILERLDREQVGGFQHTAPVLLLALGRAVIDHNDRAGMIRALIALDCKLREWAGLEAITYGPQPAPAGFAIGETPPENGGGHAIPPAAPEAEPPPA